LSSIVIDAIEIDESPILSQSSQASSVKSASTHFTNKDLEDLALLTKIPIKASDPKLRPFKPDWNFIKGYCDPKKSNIKDMQDSSPHPSSHPKLLKGLQILIDGNRVNRGEQGMTYLEVQVDDSPRARIVVYCVVCHEMHSNSKRSEWADGILITPMSTSDIDR